MVTDVLSGNLPQSIAQAAAALRAGRLVAFPTETVYGLGANALSAEAVQKIFEVKGRPANNPLIVHVADATWVDRVASDWPDIAARLAGAFWPGPLSIVVPRGPRIPDVVTAGGPTVAIRAPAHPVAQAILWAANVPVAAPSANRSNQLSPTTAEHVVRSLEGRVDLVIDGGPTSGGLESTVLDVTRHPAQLLRPGLITRQQIEAVVGPIEVAQHMKGCEAIRSPGQMLKHYAPHTRLECLASGGRERALALVQSGQKVGWLTRAMETMPPPEIVVRCLPTEPRAYAAQLYAALHELDELKLDVIIVDLPPDADEWLAPRDRLKRAATPE